MKKVIAFAFLLMFSFTLSACNNEQEYINGTFTGYSDPWEIESLGMAVGYEQADVTFENNEIVEIKLRRIWTDDQEVDYSMFDGNHSSGRPNLKDFRFDLAEDMLEADDPTKVDSITGATISSDGWKQAVERAMEKAEK